MSIPDCLVGYENMIITQLNNFTEGHKGDSVDMVVGGGANDDVKDSCSVGLLHHFQSLT